MTDDEALNVQVFCAEDKDSGQRLDVFLAGRDSGLSRSRIKALIVDGAVALNGPVCRDPAKKLRVGDVVEIIVPLPENAVPAPEDIPLNVIYEDDDLIVINKAAGMVVHPAPGHSSGTLVNALLHHCGESLSGIGGVRRPGIIHRIDKDTTGLMAAAKNDAAHRALSSQLSDRTLTRLYKALVWGVPVHRKGAVKDPIGRHPVSRQKMAVNKKNGREAITHYVVEKNLGAASTLLECRLETGRTHQIRVHMAHMGHPLVGDAVYGIQRTGAVSLLKKAGYGDREQEAIMAFPRQALHAWKISFIHPRTGNEMIFEVPLPDDMNDLISYFKSNS
ncbi:MAG: RluA family pseudouridine synthase [Proteobacteria bacterium]|nr:RluA family pseudouridine synthase [Pseudomonadota bacterium]